MVKLHGHQQGWVFLLFFGQAFSLPSPPAHACCHAANTHAFVHVKHFDGQVSIPTLCMPLQYCQTAAELQPPLGWEVAAADIAVQCHSAF